MDDLTMFTCTIMSLMLTSSLLLDRSGRFAQGGDLSEQCQIAWAQHCAHHYSGKVGLLPGCDAHVCLSGQCITLHTPNGPYPASSSHTWPYPHPVCTSCALGLPLTVSKAASLGVQHPASTVVHPLDESGVGRTASSKHAAQAVRGH